MIVDKLRGNIRFSGMLGSINLYLDPDVLRQLVGPIYRSSVTNCQSALRNIPKEPRSALHTRPTQRLTKPPPFQKLGAENHTLQPKI